LLEKVGTTAVVLEDAGIKLGTWYFGKEILTDLPFIEGKVDLNPDEQYCFVL
jgi:hypothetical protein